MNYDLIFGDLAHSQTIMGKATRVERYQWKLPFSQGQHSSCRYEEVSLWSLFSIPLKYRWQRGQIPEMELHPSHWKMSFFGFSGRVRTKSWEQWSWRVVTSSTRDTASDIQNVAVPEDLAPKEFELVCWDGPPNVPDRVTRRVSAGTPPSSTDGNRDAVSISVHFLPENVSRKGYDKMPNGWKGAPLKGETPKLAEAPNLFVVEASIVVIGPCPVSFSWIGACSSLSFRWASLLSCLGDRRSNS